MAFMQKQLALNKIEKSESKKAIHELRELT